MTIAALILTLALLGALTVMQFLLIAGAPIGHYAWGGKHRVLPGKLRIASGAAIVLYGVFGALLLSRAGVVPGGGDPPVIVATWFLFAYSALSVVGNLASRSRQERLVQTPVSALLSIGILILALAPAP
ncbi:MULTISPECIES: hypothetical protein [unclassified Arthrobacter]|uniref:hypothetical protein n=1 Tax=unclassified Arthrobacter TaxID=235627 RepID=UPI00149119BC|nr:MULTISPECIES: hypothetical protein [unclassified Arthrobacter]MBE0011580.1 hypothetical protein [Arthrobacter sp. AET 35A]NOJ61463.1 hypothetical protein [Arthrobacter sp. 260]